MLYVGEGGTGKTTAALTLANVGKVLAINAESGIKARPLSRRGINISNIEVFPGEGETLTYDTLREQFIRLREELDVDPNAYAGVVWDSITEIHMQLVGLAKDKRIERQRRAGKDPDPTLTTQEDYGHMSTQVRQLMRDFRDLPIHWAVTALPRRNQEGDGSIRYAPQVTPGLQTDLVGFMDVICWTSLVNVGGEVERRGLFGQGEDPKFTGKDRLDAVPLWLVDPTAERVLKYVDEELVAADGDDGIRKMDPKDPVYVAALKRHEAAKNKNNQEEK